MENKYKIIFVDIDWTILNHWIHDWDYESLDALKKAQEKGVLVYLCTARPFDSVLHTGIFEHFNPDGVIATNGGVAFIGKDILFSNDIPQEIVKEVENTANRHDLVVEMCTNRDRFFSAPVNEWVEEYFKSYAETVPPIAQNVHENVSAMLLFAPEFMDEELIRELPKEIRYYRFDLYGVDLCYFENTKGVAIKRVLEALTLDKSDAVGIGDDYGDIPMFEEVGLSIGMGNGKPDAIDKATYKAESIADHGLAKALKELKII